jgi:hypothetical protein
MNRLIEYFQREHWYELRQFDRLNKAGRDRLRDDRETVHGDDVRRLYELWKSAQEAVRDRFERTAAIAQERSIARKSSRTMSPSTRCAIRRCRA